MCLCEDEIALLPLLYLPALLVYPSLLDNVNAAYNGDVLTTDVAVIVLVLLLGRFLLELLVLESV